MQPLHDSNVIIPPSIAMLSCHVASLCYDATYTPYLGTNTQCWRVYGYGLEAYGFMGADLKYMGIDVYGYRLEVSLLHAFEPCNS
mmetsp:Transcript_33498/g.53930  ORF Transcript_33498/g.53930 Transcript_33498/m.53930 type:complete len:85 (+) Transcript_33498:333-587(+)